MFNCQKMRMLISRTANVFRWILTRTGFQSSTAVRE